jgi:hypothetical protein
MVDNRLIADALSKCPRQLHLIANHCTCYQGNMDRFISNPGDYKYKIAAEYHEKILRSFLVTGDIRQSVKLVKR